MRKRIARLLTHNNTALGLAFSVLIPFIALGLQWLLWDYIAPFVWFLFFPTIFISARFGRFKGGLISTALSALLVVYFFIPPRMSWEKSNPYNFFSVGIFLIMGYLFSDIQERFWVANQRTQKALAETQAANQKVTQLYQKTLELDELKTQFFANVSHELRTPLMLIMGYIKKVQLSFKFDPTARYDLEIAERNTRLLQRHVNDLLDISKLDAGQMEVEYTGFDLAQFTRVVASQFNLLAEDRGIHFSLALPAALPVQADTEKLQRILLNLISNAFKFTPDGGQINISLSAEADFAILRVEDSGSGIPEDKRELIFERFRQLKGGATRQHGGTGLGLSIVKEFTQLHRGTVQVEQSALGGALFCVRIPLSAPQGTPIQPQPAAPFLEDASKQPLLDELTQERRGIRSVNGLRDESMPLILVVEDNPDMNEFISAALSQKYRVASAPNGLAGLQKALALKPDLVLSDMMMPDMSGDELARQLRQREESKEIPFIMLTARVDEQLRIQMLREGVQDYLNKPFSIDELLARVENWVSVQRQSSQKIKTVEQLYSNLVQNMMEGFAFCRMIYENGQACDWEYLVVNHAFEVLTGLSNAAGKRVSELIPGISPENTEVFALYERVASTGEPEKFETYLEPLQMWFSVSAYCPEKGYFVAVFDVITQRKQAEKQILELNTILEQRVKERTAQLEASNQELQAFSYSVSHDLRTPLRSIEGYSSLLLTDEDFHLDEQAKLYLNNINLATRRMASLIDDLLRLSRIMRRELECRPVDLSQIADGIAKNLQAGAPERVVHFEITPGLSAYADPGMMEIVLSNLLENAFKFTSKTEKAEIRVGVSGQAGEPVFFVRDNGVGFDMAYADKLFKPFQRLHSVTEFPGTGIGLTIIQRIITRHAGRVWVEAAPGQGATFYFTLGRVPPAT